MKTMKVSLVIGLAMVLASTASAISIDWASIDLQYVEFKLVSWDMSTIYSSPASTAGIAGVNALSQNQYASANGTYYTTSGGTCTVNDPYREDGWGIFRVTEIIDKRTGEAYWQGGSSGEEIYGIYYGKIDNAVLSGTNSYDVQSQGVQIDFYLNSAGTFAAAGGAMQGSAGRTAFDEYNGISGGQLLMSTYSLQSGKDALLGVGNNEFQEHWNTTGPNAGTGDYISRLRLTGGLWYDDLYTGYVNGDLEMAGHSYLNETEYGGTPIGDWTTRSQDPITPIIPPAIPEPLTMLGVGLGLMGLGSYIRRRMS